MKTPVPVDLEALKKCVEECEAEQPEGRFANLNLLWKAVADRYNKVVKPAKEITFSVVYLRVTNEGIPHNTQAGKRGAGGSKRKKVSSVSRELLEEALKQAGGQKNQGVLFVVVAEIYNRIKPENYKEITKNIVRSRLMEWNLVEGGKNVPVDIQALRDAVEYCESQTQFPTLQAMYRAVADRYNEVIQPQRLLSKGTVQLRIGEHKIPHKTKAAPKGKGAPVIDADACRKELQSAVDECEAKTTFPTQSDLWDAVAEKTGLEKGIVVSRATRFGVTCKTEPRKGRRHITDEQKNQLQECVDHCLEQRTPDNPYPGPKVFCEDVVARHTVVYAPKKPLKASVVWGLIRKAELECDESKVVIGVRSRKLDAESADCAIPDEDFWLEHGFREITPSDSRKVKYDNTIRLWQDEVGEYQIQFATSFMGVNLSDAPFKLLHRQHPVASELRSVAKTLKAYAKHKAQPKLEQKPTKVKVKRAS